jgi:hypothetical protein
MFDLELTPAAYELHEGAEVGDVPRSPSRSDLVWELSHGGPAWQSAAEWHTARVTLPTSGGGVVTDAEFGGGNRTARTARVTARAVREWAALELYALEPAGTSIGYRLEDGSAEWWWDGSAWSDAPASSEWNTAAELEANVSTWPSTARRVAVVAKLSSTSATARPVFYGARVAARAMELDGEEGDALYRGLLGSLRASLRVAGVQEGAAVDADELYVGGGTVEVITVDHAYDLTADPNAVTALAGTHNPGDPTQAIPSTWSPSSPATVGNVYRLEYTWRPFIVARQHPEIEQLDRIPAVYLAFASAAPSVLAHSAPLLVRDLHASPPTALELSQEQRQQTIEIRIVAELGSQVRQITRVLSAWLGSSRHRLILSPETGQAIGVHEIEPPGSGNDGIAQGVHEARARWALTYSAITSGEFRARTLIKTGGVTTTEE